MTLRQRMRLAAERLHHLSMVYVGAMAEVGQGRELGLIPQGYPGLSNLRDLIDLILLCRAEINGLTKLCVDAKLFTAEQLTERMIEEYEWLTKQKADKFGCTVTDVGLTFHGPDPRRN